MKIKMTFLALLFIISNLVVFAQSKKDTIELKVNQKVQNIDSLAQSKHQASVITYIKAHNTGSLEDFPKLHPMIVHFPIVLIILALISQLLSFFILKDELSWVTIVLIVGGFIGAIFASYIVHGGDLDVSKVNIIIKETFEKHEKYATLTVWISGLAMVAKLFSHFIFKKKLISEIIVACLLLGATYTIAVTGDMGARLVYIQTIGVQGNQIPEHDED